MQALDLLADTRMPVPQIAHHLRIGVELDLVLEVFVRYRDKFDAAGAERVLCLGLILTGPALTGCPDPVVELATSWFRARKA